MTDDKNEQVYNNIYLQQIEMDYTTKLWAIWMNVWYYHQLNTIESLKWYKGCKARY